MAKENVNLKNFLYMKKIVGKSTFSVFIAYLKGQRFNLAVKFNFVNKKYGFGNEYILKEMLSYKKSLPT